VSSLFRWGGRKSEAASPRPSSASDEPAVTATRVLPKLLRSLGAIEAPVLMDLGPVVGSNIAFLGEELGCRIFVEDLFAVVESHHRAGTREALVEGLPSRLTREDASIDGILCWDLFDYLDRPAAQPLAARLMAMLKPGGVLYAFFGSKPGQITHYNRFQIEASDRFAVRQVPATAVERLVLVNRDVNRMFDGLVVSESVLLKSNARETLFRKPAP
jgi:hypothetical protein